MKASESKWPYRPVHITNDGKKSGNPKLLKLRGIGIISNEHLQGIETAICANIRNPTAVIEFGTGGELVRTDSPLLEPAQPVFGFRPACTTFRKYTDDKYCDECDNIHTRLFYGLSKSNIKGHVNRAVKEDRLLRKYHSEAGIDIEFKTTNDRYYLEYDCPLLGYRELVFPVFFEGKVIGLFCTGQICLADKLEFIKRKQEEFFRDHPECFSEYCEKNPDRMPDKLREEVLAAHERWVGDQSHILKGGGYEALVKKSSSGLAGLERTLAEQMGLERERYVREKIDVSVKKFRSNLPEERVSSDEKRTYLWQNVQQRLEFLCRAFAIKYVVVFARGSLSRDELASLRVVTQAGDVPKAIRQAVESGELKYDLSKVPEAPYDQWVTSREDERFFDGLVGLPEKLDRELSLVRVFPVPLFSQAGLVALVGYHDWNPLESVVNRARGQLSVALQSFYTVVLSAFSSVLADSSETRLKRTLRVQHHEINNSIQVLYQRMHQVLREIPKETLGEEAIKLGFKNIEEGLRLLEQHTIWPRFLTGKYSVNTTRVPVLAMMHRWRDFYAPEIGAKCLIVKVPPADAQDPDHPKPVADAELLELAVSNLIKNAVNYAYDGTTIDLSSYRDSSKRLNEIHRIEVSNYGFEIEESERALIYELFYRAAKAEEITGKDESQGAGLFVVKTCIQAHGWPFELPQSTFISDFCIPILYWLEKKDSWNMITNRLLRDKAKSEYDLKKEQIDSICGVRFLRKRYNFMIEKTLVRETYKNVFKILIP